MVYEQQQYWNGRYQAEGKIWGEQPSVTAQLALQHFLVQKVTRVLVIGAGYGRNTRAFSQAGLQVNGVEISEQAISLARSYDPLTTFRHGSVLDLIDEDAGYEAIYGFNILHLFRRDDRLRLLHGCWQNLVENGLIFLTVFSEQEASYGKGEQIEPHTFESKSGRPVHYFDEADLTSQMPPFTIRETGLIHDAEDHGEEGPHTHLLRYVLAEKRA